MTDKKRKEQPNNIEKRELNFLTCPRHGIQYPKGSECPRCLAESKR